MARLPKLLVCAWLPGQGCRYLRSAEMTDSEARGLLQAARGTIQSAQESGEVEEVAGTKDRVFVLARRAPDPDAPQRMTPGFVLAALPDVDAFLRQAVADQLRAVPEVTAISDSGGWQFLDLGSGSKRVVDSAGLVTRRDRGLGGASRLVRDPWIGYLVLTLVLVIFAVCIYSGLPSASSSVESDRSAVPAEPQRDRQRGTD
jgi:hypothetical protein